MSEFGAEGSALALQRVHLRVPSWLETCGACLHARLKLGAQPDE